MSTQIEIRDASQADGSFLADMVVEAANWNRERFRPRHEVLSGAAHRRYIAGWQRPGDVGVVAEDGGGIAVGAAWYRTFPASDPGFDWVGVGVPELIIGVSAPWRAQGVGRLMLRALCQRAARGGVRRLALSVDEDNFATALYRSEGFVWERGQGGRDTMVRRFG